MNNNLLGSGSGAMWSMRGRRSRFKNGLKKLISHVDIENAIMAEIGCYQGESTEIFCQSDKISKIFAVDPWKSDYDPDEPVALRSDFEAVEKAFDKRVEPYNKVVKIKNSSHKAVKNFKKHTLDLVYLDGDHRYEHVINDIVMWHAKIKTGGYLAGHDYGMEEVHKAILDTIRRVPDKIFKDNSWVFRI